MFKNTKILVFGLLTSCFFLFSQCEKVNLSENSDSAAENSDYSNARITETKNAASDGEMVLGKKLENPYNIKNMDKALKSLKSKGIKSSLSKIEGNYYYVRLLPKTDDEYNLINSDPSIDIYEYPLDVEIVKQGNKYKDKSVGNNKFTQGLFIKNHNNFIISYLYK